MRRAAILALGLGLAASFLPGPLAAQELVTGLSTENIALTANFTGSEVLVFGAIRRDAPIPPGQSPIDVVITLSGPERNVVVRRKARRFGIWLNAEEIVVRRAPSYYAVAGTGPDPPSDCVPAGHRAGAWWPEVPASAAMAACLRAPRASGAVASMGIARAPPRHR